MIAPITYGAGAEGRTTGVSVAAPNQSPVTGIAFNYSNQVTSVTYGSGDSDSFSYDANTGRMTQYQFNVGSSSMKGQLSWNTNGTLQQLAITDPFNAADQQTCSYTYDDLARIITADCGSGFSQNFWAGLLGNVTKTGTFSFSPSYNLSTNQITTVGGQSYTYDADGNLKSTGSGTGTNAYTWDAFGEMVSDTPSGGGIIGVDYDALGRPAMTNVNGSSYTEFVYAPDGSKLALMNGQTLYKARVELPGGGLAIYDPTGLIRYWHSDWQGTMRLVSNPSSPTYYWSGAYAPYRETYAESGNPFFPDFASLIGDTSSELDDAMFREYNPTEGRWLSPDPAGLAAVDLTNPQSLNRYAYVMNNPTTLTDPSGFDTIVCGKGAGRTVSCPVELQNYTWYEQEFQLTAVPTLYYWGTVSLQPQTVGPEGELYGAIVADVYLLVPSLATWGNLLDWSPTQTADAANTDSPARAFIKTLFSIQPQIDAWKSGYYSCIGDEMVPFKGLLAWAGAQFFEHGALEAADAAAPKMAGAYYHFTDGRFTAWGNSSKVLVPQAAEGIRGVLNWVKVGGLAVTDAELAHAIYTCSGKLQ